jgi:hypothetical protein
MQEIRGFLNAFEKLNASSTEFASVNWGEIDADRPVKGQVEKWLSSSNRVAEVISLDDVTNEAAKKLKAALIPWMFHFAGVNREKDGSINYSGNVLTKERRGRLALDSKDYFGVPAKLLVEMLLNKTEPDELLRITWKLSYRREGGQEPAPMEPYMGDHWCAFVFKNSTKMYFLALTSMLN